MIVTRSCFTPLLVGTFAVICLSGCAPTGDGVTGPQSSGDLVVTATANPSGILVGEAVSFRAVASGGTPPYLYRWDQNDGPVDVDLSGIDVTDDVLTLTDIMNVGRYVFRVLVTDSENRTQTGFAKLIVDPGVGITATNESDEVFEGETATLSAATDRGIPPFSFAWRQVDGPAELDLEDATGDMLTTPPFSAFGLYTFEVTVTDAGGFIASDSVDVDVQSAVTLADPGLATAGEPTDLSITLETEAEGLTFLWSVLEGSAAFDDATAQNPTITTDADETLSLEVTVTIPTEDGSTVDVKRELQVVSVTTETPRVVLETTLGSFTIELDAQETPLHTANFLFYVDTEFYVDVLFHRVVNTPEPFIIQGGGFKREDGELAFQDPTRDPIVSESAGQAALALHDVALALSGSDSASGTSQFFVSLVDENDFPGVEGFTVFGRVVDGFDTIDAIAAVETESNPLAPAGEVSLPVEDVIILSATRLLP
ncbi:MAG: peptidylprolyl isomerase [Planctomycetes bacterium]|nr:peptidylprolyl isomerase [Planctomycetota bacterium]